MSSNLIALEQEALPPLLKIRLPFSHRLNCFIRLWLLKLLASTVFAIARFLYPSPPHLRPTLTKHYPCRPHLQTRLFFPPTYQAGHLLPLYLDIHGGGFALCDPQQDDEFCVMWARRTGMLVVSLDYSKAPRCPYPTAVHDIAALARAVLADADLPIDKNQVVMGGFSAGGNLALCASQLAGLKGHVKAALIFYPIVDWAHTQAHKLAVRPYSGREDSFESSSYWFDWAYVPAGQDRRDPRLSPCYAARGDLPPWIYMVAAEWDMLRLESQEWIYELAGLGGEVDQEEDFERGRYKWTLARGCTHGFTHHFGRRAEEKRRREERCEPIYVEAERWVKKALAAG